MIARNWTKIHISIQQGLQHPSTSIDSEEYPPYPQTHILLLSAKVYYCTKRLQNRKSGLRQKEASTTTNQELGCPNNSTISLLCPHDHPHYLSHVWWSNPHKSPRLKRLPMCSSMAPPSQKELTSEHPMENSTGKQFLNPPDMTRT